MLTLHVGMVADFKSEYPAGFRRNPHYIGKDNPTRAMSFVQELRAKTEPLAKHPEIGRPGRIEGTRELIAHPNYIVFYRVIHGSRTVRETRGPAVAVTW